MQRNVITDSGNNAPERSPYVPPREAERQPQDSLNTEKVLNIIRNWRIKFTGHSDSIGVEELIYRINILTVNNLR